jgi:hypothetical protein
LLPEDGKFIVKERLEPSEIDKKLLKIDTNKFNKANDKSGFNKIGFNSGTEL